MSDLKGNKITMLAPCQGRFGGRNVLLNSNRGPSKRGLVINLLRKKFQGLKKMDQSKTSMKCFQNGQKKLAIDLSANLLNHEIGELKIP